VSEHETEYHFTIHVIQSTKRTKPCVIQSDWSTTRSHRPRSHHPWFDQSLVDLGSTHV